MLWPTVTQPSSLFKRRRATVKPSIKTIASYYRCGTLDELLRKGQMSKAEYDRHVEAVKAYEAKSK